MEAVEQKILLDQIIAAYKKTYMVKNWPLSVERDLEIFFSRNVDGKTLVQIGTEFGISGNRIRQIEEKTTRRLNTIISRLKLKDMF